MSDTPLHDTPYKGLLPYAEEDEQFFFGREPEQDIITANLMATRLTLLYGPSGVGKSSVLRAGVASDLRKQARENLSTRNVPRFVVVVFRNWKDDPLTGLLKEIRETVEDSFAGKPFEEVPRDLPFVDELAQWTERVKGKLFIVLDQFEEYFLYPQKEDESSFAVQFPRAVKKPDLPVNFLISIREDWLAKLDRFKNDLTNLFDNYLRIDRLDRKAARAAIELPVARYNEVRKPEEPEVQLSPGFAEKVIDQLEGLANKNVLGQSGSGQVKGLEKSQVTKTNIQPPYLQLVMIHLWKEALQSKTYKLDPEMLAQEDRAEKIVQSHLEEVMNKLSPQDQEAASRVFNHLVTPSGVKVAQTLSDLAGYAKLSKTEIASMLNTLSEKESGIISQLVPPPGQPAEIRYEIYHDVLAPAVLRWRQQYVNAKELREAHERTEKERLNARAQTRIATRLRWVSFALLVITVLAILSAIFGVNQARRARTLQRENAIAQHHVNETRRLADLAIKQSELDKAAATKEKEDAEYAKDQAVIAQNQATTERLRANQIKTEALNVQKRAASYEKLSKVYDDVITLTRAKDLNHVKEKYLELGDFYKKSGEFSKQANQLLQVAQTVRDISLDPASLTEALTYYDASRSLYHRDNNAKGEAEALIGIGETQAYANQNQLALEAYIDAAFLYKQPKDEAGKAAMADVLARLDSIARYLPGDEKEIASRIRLLRVFHGNQDYQLREIDTNKRIGDIYFTLKQTNDAIKYYTAALQLNQKDIDALKVLGDLYYLQNNPQKAVPYYEQADKLFKDGVAPTTTSQVVLWASLGDINRQQHNTKKALEYYSQIQSLASYQCVGLKKSGDLLFASGEKDAALDYYLKITEAVDVNPTCLAIKIDSQFSGPIYVYEGLAQPVELELEIVNKMLPIYEERKDTVNIDKFSKRAENLKKILRGETPEEQSFDLTQSWLQFQSEKENPTHYGSEWDFCFYAEID